MEVVLIIAAIVIVFPYVAGPILLWRSGSPILPTQLEYVESNTPLSQAAEAHFWKTTHFFSSNGFQQLDGRVRESASNGLSGYKQVWRNQETGEIALVGTFLNANDESFCNTFVAFMHDRGNGAKLITSNFDPGARTLLEPAGTSKVCLRGHDLTELRVVHRAHIALRGAERVRPLRVRDALTLCKELDAGTRQRALETKRFRSHGDTLRITFWGAIVGIWINLPPLKGKFEREERRFLDQVLAATNPPGGTPMPRAA